MPKQHDDFHSQPYGSDFLLGPNYIANQKQLEQQAAQIEHMQAMIDAREKEKKEAEEAAMLQEAAMQQDAINRGVENLVLSKHPGFRSSQKNNSYVDIFKNLTGNLLGNMASYGGNLYDGETNPTGQMTTSKPVYTNKVRQRLDGKANRFDDGGNTISKIYNPETGETGNILLGMNPDGSHRVQYSNGILPMNLALDEVTAFGRYNPRIMPPEEKEALMRIERGLDEPLVGGELNNNQYRTMPTNSEASNFADKYVGATEFKPWHLVTAPMKGLDLLASSKWVGLTDDDNDMGFAYLYSDRNPGFFVGNDPTKPFSKRFAQEHPNIVAGTNFVGDLATGYGIGKGIGLVGDAYNAGKTAIATSTNPKMQYVRYGLGKMKGWMHGYNPKLPTLYRKVKGMPTLEDGKIIISTPENRFAYESGLGQESPLITNFSSDVGVRRHPDGNWNWAPTLAMPGESLLGKNVISTRPSDTFTFGDMISVPAKKVTAITGRQKELNYFNDLGIKTISSPEAQSSFGDDLAAYMADARKARARNAKILERKKMGYMTPKRKWPEKNFNNYASEIQKVTRANFRNPTMEDYEFMDYVFRPQYTSEVVPNMDITKAVSLYPSLVGDWYGNSGRRMYIANPDEWVNVMYDPYSPAEALFRKSRGIDLKPEWQNK